MVARTDFFHGSSEFRTSSAEAVSGDVFELVSRNTAGDILNLLFVAPNNGGSLAGYKGGLVCSNVDPLCGGSQSSFSAGYISLETEDLVYVGAVVKAGPVPMVRIAIRSHGEGPALIDPRSHLLSTIAVISIRHFDALTDVDTQFLTFGPTGIEQSITSCDKDGRDVDNDGVPDLICHFNPRLTQFLPSESLGILIGKTIQGSPFAGTVRVQIKPPRGQQ